MKKYISVSIVGIMVFSLAWASTVYSAEGGQRYFIRSQSKLLKVLVGERWNFNEGFTAELTSAHRKLIERLTGADVEEVALYRTLAIETSGRSVGKPVKDGSRSVVPSDQTPWGIERAYNDPLLAVTSGGENVDVAVLDTGVLKEHLDLSRRLKQCKDFSGRALIKDGACKDGNGHGTHVAGTVLADGGIDGKGVYGVAPSANLFAYKVCGSSGFCWADDIAIAIRHAADQGAEVISMSLGSNSESALIRDAIAYAESKGSLIIAAAGNNGPSLGSINYPGANVSVLAIGAIDVGEFVPDWSSRGINDGDFIVEEREVEFGAPGVAIESTWNDGKYRLLSGTSMATPHVSGLAAKLWQGSATGTRAHLQSLARDLWDAGDDPATGFGLPYAH